jgi:formamidopyrimidine-DNA glycosylase
MCTAMPELPEVESVRRQLQPRLAGRAIRAVRAAPQRRFLDVGAAAGGRIVGVGRRGKYLVVPLERPGRGPVDLVMHLGMTGSFRFRGDLWDQRPWQGDAYVRATFELDDGTLDFRDVRRFGRLAIVPAGAYGAIPTLAVLGPEPLGPDFTPASLQAGLAATRAPVKPFLLSQRPVAGVGNIYADEALWRARIHPRSRAVGPVRARRLWGAIRDVLAEAIEREGTTFRDYQMVNGESGRNAPFLAVYGRSGLPCQRCGALLRRTVIGGRGTTFCGRCQKS